MSRLVARYNERLSQAFAGRDFFEAHRRAGPILAEMAADAGVLREAALAAALAPGFFARARINPVLALKLGEDRNYSLIAHLWLPLDDGRTDLTHQSVHHHGKLLLSSVSAWGAGYESVLFKSGFRVEEGTGRTEMAVDRIYRNPRGHLEFVGPDTPHVVFFPAGFTVTYALWSRSQPQAAGVLKSIPGVQAYKKRIKDGLHRLGLAGRLGLNVVEKLDFYPRGGELIQMVERVNYRPGTAPNFLANFFWSLRQMELGNDFAAMGALRDHIREAGGGTRAAELFARLEGGEPLERRMEPLHLGVERVQFTRAELLACFPRHAERAG